MFPQQQEVANVCVGSLLHQQHIAMWAGPKAGGRVLIFMDSSFLFLLPVCSHVARQHQRKHKSGNLTEAAGGALSKSPASRVSLNAALSATLTRIKAPSLNHNQSEPFQTCSVVELITAEKSSVSSCSLNVSITSTSIVCEDLSVAEISQTTARS